MRHLRIGTRGSTLALWQAEQVRGALRRAHPGLEVELLVISTRGDKVLDVPLARLGSQGAFTKEIEEWLLAARVDLAVHSLKDLPVQLAPGLALAAVPPREDPADVLVSRDGAGLADLRPGARVLTGSLRRRAFLLHLRPDLAVENVRGNVETRLRRFSESEADAIVFARAGLARLGLAHRVSERFDPRAFPPAGGQGALAVEARAGDAEAIGLCGPLNDPRAAAATAAERAFLEALGGGCQVPIGAYARLEDDGRTLALTGAVADPDGRRLIRETASEPVDGADPAALARHGVRLGGSLADAMLRSGGREILGQVLQQQFLGPEAAP